MKKLHEKDLINIKTEKHLTVSPRNNDRLNTFRGDSIKQTTRLQEIWR